MDGVVEKGEGVTLREANFNGSWRMQYGMYSSIPNIFSSQGTGCGLSCKSTIRAERLWPCKCIFYCEHSTRLIYEQIVIKSGIN